MSKAEDLVSEAEKTKAGVPIDINSLIIELMSGEGITKELATKKIGMAIMKWRNSRPPTVTEKVVRASIEETGKPKPKDLEFTDRD
jgi:hypothetical protein